jgi:guanylate kinase
MNEQPVNEPTGHETGLTVETGKLVVISGPSGVGKSTIVREVLKRTRAVYSVSATTRPPRRGEVDGRDYRFVDRAEFQRMIDAGELLEFTEVFGRMYGTPAGPIRGALWEGKTVVLDIDVRGAQQIASKMPGTTFVLIAPPDEEELARRLRGRGTESPDALKRRLAKARHELGVATKSGVYNHVVINDDLESAVQRVVGIVNKERPQR